MEANINITSISALFLGIILAFLILFLCCYLQDSTTVFARLTGTMDPEDYYQERNYIGLYRRLKKCEKIKVGSMEMDSAGIAEICRFASLADSKRWISLTDPDVVDALTYLASMKIIVDIWADESEVHTDTNAFRVHLYCMNNHYEEVAGKYQNEYCVNTISSQRLVQFANELREDMSHVK